jgi:hypothetical protein
VSSPYRPKPEQQRPDRWRPSVPTWARALAGHLGNLMHAIGAYLLRLVVGLAIIAAVISCVWLVFPGTWHLGHWAWVHMDWGSERWAPDFMTFCEWCTGVFLGLTPVWIPWMGSTLLDSRGAR